MRYLGRPWCHRQAAGYSLRGHIPGSSSLAGRGPLEPFAKVRILPPEPLGVLVGLRANGAVARSAGPGGRAPGAPRDWWYRPVSSCRPVPVRSGSGPRGLWRRLAGPLTFMRSLLTLGLVLVGVHGDVRVACWGRLIVEAGFVQDPGSTPVAGWHRRPVWAGRGAGQVAWCRCTGG